MDHLTALRVFRHVAELGSFAEAARELRLSPPAISKNISELETHLGVRLFNRTTRRVSRTDAGARYYEQVSRILDDLAQADASLGPMQVTPSGVLRVAAPMTLTLLRLSAAMPAFLARHPELTVDLQMSDRRVNIIEEGSRCGDPRQRCHEGLQPDRPQADDDAACGVRVAGLSGPRWRTGRAC